MQPKIKLSDNIAKMTNPGFKKLFRVYQDNFACADVMFHYDELIKGDLTMYHPTETWKSKTLKEGTFELEDLHVPVFLNGDCVYPEEDLEVLRKRLQKDLERMWEEVKRFENPQEYYVDLSEKLVNMKLDMLKKFKEQ